jgi:hypothetical protein
MGYGIEGPRMSFVVHLWSEDVDSEGNPSNWRAEIKHVGSGQSLTFEVKDIARLVDFINRRAGCYVIEPPSSPDWQKVQCGGAPR